MSLIINYFSSFLVIEKKIYDGTDHPSIANTLYSIAQQQGNLGQFEKALQGYEDVLGKRIQLFNDIKDSAD
jgi:hypothetical protein